MSSSASDAIHLDEMLAAAARLRRLVARTTLEAFEDDEAIYDAVCMNLLRIGEGARLLSDAAKAALPQIPWPDVVNLRHRIAHGYSHLRPSVIWTTATVSVPGLTPALAGLRASLV